MLNQPVIYPDDELVSLPQVARILCVAPMTARVWVLEGKIPAKQAGRQIFVRRADLDTFAATRG